MQAQGCWFAKATYFDTVANWNLHIQMTVLYARVVPLAAGLQPLAVNLPYFGPTGCLIKEQKKLNKHKIMDYSMNTELGVSDIVSLM